MTAMARAPDTSTPLSREAFADAALALVDERGVDGLTVRALGARMGVHPTAFYRYFSDKRDLIEAALARMLEQADVTIPDHGTPRDCLLAIMRGLRRAFAAHPNMALPNLTEQDEQATAGMVRVAFRSLEQMGLHGRDLMVCYQALETFSVGTNAYDYANYPESHERRQRGRRMVGHPVADEYSRDIGQIAEINDAAFEFGAAALLDACEAMGRGERTAP